MEKKESKIQGLLTVPRFWRQQQNNWKVTVVRTSLERLGYKTIYPYLSLYIIALGAQKTQLGLITSLGMILAAVISPFTGKIIDNNGPKGLYIFGIITLLVSYITYLIAPDWRYCVLAMMLYWLGNTTSIHSCSTICGNCLPNQDRARGMLICESLAAGLLGMIGPLMGAFVLGKIIGAPETGASAKQYSYLFYIPLVCTVLSLILVLRRLTNDMPYCSKKNVSLKDGWQLLKENRYARRWILIGAVQKTPQAMVLPFITVFAQEERLVSDSMLAAMVVVSGLTSVLLGYSIGSIADRFGRKKVLLVIYPLYWLSSIVLILSGAGWAVLISGFLQGFNDISGPLSSAVQRELVEPRIMGTWIGIVNLTSNIFCAIMALVAGVIYDKVGPIWVFLIFIAMDAFIRVPLLISLPETLHAQKTSD